MGGGGFVFKFLLNDRTGKTMLHNIVPMLLFNQKQGFRVSIIGQLWWTLKNHGYSIKNKDKDTLVRHDLLKSGNFI